MKSTEWKEIKEVFTAAFELFGAERSAFLDNQPADIRGKVEKLLRANDDAKDFISEPAMVEIGLSEEEKPDFYVGKQIDSYKIIREIGHGGMGTVYLANRADESFDKPVAVKLIKRGMDTSAVLKRFMMERQILANLEHHHIAGLVDGGSTEDGLPYLVMEYVEGVPITKFCNGHQYTTHERLDLFRKVCSAVSHAHQNLVVHRDIKPSNILVTGDGEPKLLDFGIAKLLHPDWSLDTAEATVTMHRIMTPEYASPEQMRGLTITTASDVYSLGVVLYELLSGERPYKIHSRLPDEAAHIILTVKPVKPSSVVILESKVQGPRSKVTDNNNDQTAADFEKNLKSQISNRKLLQGDLDNIIMKALRKEPERRYASVQEFSEDIRRHLAGLPVTATADTASYRVEKFVKRHRLGVISFAAVFVTLLVSTSITAWQAVVAGRERDRAEQRFTQVRKLARSILFDYQESIKEMPGATEVRGKMISDSVEYLDNLANESDYSLDLQRDIVAAYRKVGDIQGSFAGGGNLSKNEAALESFRKALAIQESIVAANPESSEDNQMLARLLLDIAQQQEYTGDSNSWEAFARRAIEIFKKITVELPAETKPRSDLARGLWTLASAVRSGGDLDGALEAYRQSAEIYEKLAAEKPEERKYIRNAALTYKNIGGVLELKKDFVSASEYYNKALLIDRKNADEEPDSTTNQMDLSFTFGSLASVSMNLGDFNAALEHNRNKLAIQEKVAAADPKNAFAQSSLAKTYRMFGEIWTMLEKFDEAALNHQKSIKIYERLLAFDPKNVKRSVALAEGYSIFGNFLSNNPGKDSQLIRLNQAEKLQRLGMDIFEELKSKNTIDKASEETLTDARKNWQETVDEIARLNAK